MLKILIVMLFWCLSVFSGVVYASSVELISTNAMEKKVYPLWSAKNPNESWQIGFYINANLSDGHDIGTLFQINDKNGEIISGAGFENGVITGSSVNNRQITFFFRTGSDLQIDDLGRPFEHSKYVKLISYEASLIAVDWRHENPPKKYNEATGKWELFSVNGETIDNNFNDIYSTPRGPLVFTLNSIYLNGELIFNGKERHDFFYYRNRIYMFNRGRKELSNCLWKISTDAIKDDDCVRFNLGDSVSNIYAFVPYNDDVYVFSNSANIYRIDKEKISLLFDRDVKENKLSNQFYTALNYYDEMLLGHYPTGGVYRFKPPVLSIFRPAIPAAHPSQHNAREAQSMAIYMGELYVGVWPWGEIWRYSDLKDEWSLAVRLFTSKRTNENNPYRNAIKFLSKKGLKFDALDDFGQRITSLIAMNDSLYASTGNKTGTIPNQIVGSGVPGQKEEKEYGRVWKITGKYQISCPIQNSNPTYLDFLLKDGYISIDQDGRRICSLPVDRKSFSSMIKRVKAGKIHIGNGVYGSYRGDLLQEIWRGYNE